MTDKPTKRSKVKTRGYCSYCIEIVDWEVPYSFHLGRIDLVSEGPFWEHASIIIAGNFVFPKKLAGKDVKVSILGDRMMARALDSPDDFDDYEPKALGVLTVRGAQREYLGSLPMDVFPQISVLLGNGAYRYLDLHGQELYRGKSDIKSLRFEREIDPDDY